MGWLRDVVSKLSPDGAWLRQAVSKGPEDG
jgi:hypothetical protein